MEFNERVREKECFGTQWGKREKMTTRRERRERERIGKRERGKF